MITRYLRTCRIILLCHPVQAGLKAARDAGADNAFLERVVSVETMNQVGSDLAPWPVFLTMVGYGRCSTVSVQEVWDMGFKMDAWPLAGVSPAVTAMRAA